MKKYILYLLIGFFILLIGFLILIQFLPDPSILKNQYPIVRYDPILKDTEISFSKQRPNYWISIQNISKPLIGAVIVSEDWAFYSHEGVDFNQIKEAVKTDLRRKKFARGASTITQQLIKNIFLDHDKTLTRKIKELLISAEVEQILSKQKILELYFNVVEWGRGIYGINAATMFYFQKTPSQISPKEAAFLAMLLPSPKKYSQSFFAKKLTPFAEKSIKRILLNMFRAHFIDEEQKNLAFSEPLSFEATEDQVLPEIELEPEPVEIELPEISDEI